MKPSVEHLKRRKRHLKIHKYHTNVIKNARNTGFANVSHYSTVPDRKQIKSNC